MPEVKAVLGHAVIETTMRYLHVTNGERTEAIKKHPINEFLQPQVDPTQRRAV